MASKYSCCDHIKRKQLVLEVNEEVAKAIGEDFRTLPIFEKGLYEYNSRKHYSLKTNEFLNCRWLEYKKNIETYVRSPFQFIDIRDYHFYNYRNRYLPSQSIHTKTLFVRKLRPGPGVDDIGILPIPNDMFMKRGENKLDKEKKISKDLGKVDQ